jgi:hypothetical protein
MVENGYPQYARPDNGRTFEKRTRGGTVVLDNRHVVPYCPFLLLKYNAHINVEVCASVKSIKYIHKYIYKGHDRTTMILGTGDEIKQYVDSRYIAPHEAVHRILEFTMHEELPNVYRLPVHLPNQQTVVFDPEATPEQMQRRIDLLTHTRLTRFFEANENNMPGARALTYQEFPQKFKWDDTARVWVPRKRQDFAIGRMYTVPPAAGEKFYLRLLLIQRRGLTYFRDLRTIDGTEHPSFREACLALGLLEDNAEWRQCLNEGKLMAVGKFVQFTIRFFH